MENSKESNVNLWLKGLKDKSRPKYVKIINDFKLYVADKKKIGFQQNFLNYIEKLQTEGYKASTLQSIHSIIALWFKIRYDKDIEFVAHLGNKVIV